MNDQENQLNPGGPTSLKMYVLGTTHELLVSRVTALETNHSDLNTLVEENTAVTKDIQKNTEDLVTATVVFRGFLKVVTWIGVVATAVGAVIGVIVATQALGVTGI